MTEFEAKAAGILSVLKDYARDMEADLGKAARTRTDNANFGYVQPLTVTPLFSGAANQRIQLQTDIAHDYASQANRATDGLDPAGKALTVAEVAARVAVLDLVTRIQSVTTHAGAVTLVASIA